MIFIDKGTLNTKTWKQRCGWMYGNELIVAFLFKQVIFEFLVGFNGVPTQLGYSVPENCKFWFLKHDGWINLEQS